MNCPSNQDLKEWMRGDAESQDAMRGYEDHIRTCSKCQMELSLLTDDAWLNSIQSRSLVEENGREARATDFESLPESLQAQIRAIRLPQESRKCSDSFGPTEDHDGMGEGAVSVDPEQPTAVNPEITGYSIEALVGSGGFAKVYRAWDRKLERSVAIKILQDKQLDARNRARFDREARSAATLNSPYVVRVLANGETQDGAPYLVMDFVEGQDFGTWIFERHHTDESRRIRQGLEYLRQAALGCEAAHAADYLHRDIKPANILIDSKRKRAQLSDFGLVRRLDVNTLPLTSQAETLGTPAYMSPEQAASLESADQRSDVYSIGACLYELLTGRAPFQGSTFAILQKLKSTEPVAPSQIDPGVSKDLETVCLKALAKSPDDRYSSVEEMRQEFDRFLAGEPIVARRPTVLRRSWNWAKRNQAISMLLASVILSLTLGLVVSTVLWVRSEDNAEAANLLAQEVTAQNRQLAISEESLKRNQQSLKTALHNISVGLIGPKSEFAQQSISVRNMAMVEMLRSYEVLLETGEQDRELLLTIAKDLNHAAAVAYRLGMDRRCTELASFNQRVVARLQNEIENSTIEELSVLAEADVISGKILSVTGDRVAAKSHFQTAILRVSQEAGWDDSVPPVSAKTRSLWFEAKFGLLSLGRPSVGHEVTNQHLEQLLSQLDQPSLALEDKISQSRLRAEACRLLTRGVSAPVAVTWRKQRHRELDEILRLTKELGQESIDDRRALAVNRVYLAKMMAMSAESRRLALTTLESATDELSDLVNVLPRNAQFRADWVDSLALLAQMKWHGQQRQAALATQRQAIRISEDGLALDPMNFVLRRRCGGLYFGLGDWHEQLGEMASAGDAYLGGMRQARNTMRRPFTTESQDVDRELWNRCYERAQHCFEQLGDQDRLEKLEAMRDPLASLETTSL